MLLKSRVRAFAKHTRQYMIGYVALSEQMEEQDELLQDSDDVGVCLKVKMSHALMEKCVKLYRKRRSH